jgi:hypothetical protein
MPAVHQQSATTEETGAQELTTGWAASGGSGSHGWARVRQPWSLMNDKNGGIGADMADDPMLRRLTPPNAVSIARAIYEGCVGHYPRGHGRGLRNWVTRWTFRTRSAHRGTRRVRAFHDSHKPLHDKAVKSPVKQKRTDHSSATVDDS